MATNANTTDDETGHSRRQAVWTRYWASGALHSCAGSFDGNYDGAIRRVWLEAFQGLADGSRVLDLATGNGPLPRLLTESEPSSRGLSCDAVDLADVAPTWMEGAPTGWRGAVRFHSRVAVEQLPFPDRSFDLITSQYGIEYSRLDRSLPEIARVIRESGRLVFVMHHRESVTVRLAEDELLHLAWLLQADGLLDVAEAMLPPIRRALTPEGRLSLMHDPAAESIRQAFDLLQREADRRIAVAVCPDVLHECRSVIGTVMSRSGDNSIDSLTDNLKAYKQELQDSQLRLREVIACALESHTLQVQRDALSRLGIFTEFAPVVERQSIMGWLIKGHKKGGL